MSDYAQRIRAVLDLECGDSLAENIASEADKKIAQLEKTIKDHIDIIEAFNGSSLPEAWDFVNEVKDAREVLKETNQKGHE